MLCKDARRSNTFCHFQILNIGSLPDGYVKYQEAGSREVLRSKSEAAAAVPMSLSSRVVVVGIKMVV